MTLLHMPFEEAATYYGWDNLVTFSRHLPDDSATHRALDQDVAVWSSTVKTNMILADVFDAVRLFNFTFAKKGSKEPDPYERPWDPRKQRIGSDPIPISQFDSWYYGGD